MIIYIKLGILKPLKTWKLIIGNIDFLKKVMIFKTSVASTNTTICIIPTWFQTSESLIVTVMTADCGSSLVCQKDQVNEDSSLDVILSGMP